MVCRASSWFPAAAAVVCINGEPVASEAPVRLNHSDRVLLGDVTFLKFCDEAMQVSVPVALL